MKATNTAIPATPCAMAKSSGQSRKVQRSPCMSRRAGTPLCLGYRARSPDFSVESTPLRKCIRPRIVQTNNGRGIQELLRGEPKQPLGIVVAVYAEAQCPV